MCIVVVYFGVCARAAGGDWGADGGKVCCEDGVEEKRWSRRPRAARDRGLRPEDDFDCGK